VERIGVVGCGLMGGGIAEVIARSSLNVVVHDARFARTSADRACYAARFAISVGGISRQNQRTRHDPHPRSDQSNRSPQRSGTVGPLATRYSKRLAGQPHRQVRTPRVRMSLLEETLRAPLRFGAVRAKVGALLVR
jgi:hypothetical protein